MSESTAPSRPTIDGGGGSSSISNDTSNGNGNANAKTGYHLERTETGIRKLGVLKMRGKTDDLPQSWWFASTAIPLIAATIGPLANVLSIAAIVSKWRLTLPNDGQLPEGKDSAGVNIPDPEWEIILNAISLACGFIGNFFLLLNFTRRIRYIVALPLTIIFWFLATGILTGIVIAMHVYAPAVSPGETYSQGFWHAVQASVLYMIGSMILMINMLGYFLGKYPQHFDLDDDQRTLILQTMMFFFWLAGGAATFSAVCDWSYADALYFCDVTVLTIGFGDYTSSNDAGRGIVFPYSVIGIIFLGLMINSIRKFAVSMSKDKVIRAHEMNERARTFGRTVTNENELRDRLGLPRRESGDVRRPSLSGRKRSNASQTRKDSLEQFGRLEVNGRAITFHEYKNPIRAGGRGGAGRTHLRHTSTKKALSRDEKILARQQSGDKHQRRADRRKKLLLLKEEKDRFDAMREIQADTKRFRQYYALSMSVLAFGLLWCIGALVFRFAEEREQGLSYFEALYFCYVSLLTIGYGDFSPKSNPGKAFFIVWSLIAIPTMTILISDMSDTVVSAINRGTFTLADWTVMPKKGVWHKILKDYPQLLTWLQNFESKRQEKKRLKRGFSLADPDIENASVVNGKIESTPNPPTLEELATEGLSEHQLARKLAIAIKKVAQDLRADRPKKYSYEEWVDFTRLIRFSKWTEEEVEVEEEEQGLVEWDWIGEDSPMLSEVGEPQWILDRLCESLNRYTRRQARVIPEHHRQAQKHHHRHHHASDSDSDLDLTNENEEFDEKDVDDNAGEGSSGESGSKLQHHPSRTSAIHFGPDTEHHQRSKSNTTGGSVGGSGGCSDGKKGEVTRIHGKTEDEALKAWEKRLEDRKRREKDAKRKAKEGEGEKGEK